LDLEPLPLLRQYTKPGEIRSLLSDPERPGRRPPDRLSFDGSRM